MTTTLATQSVGQSTFASVTGDLIARLLAYHAKYGSWPHTWAPYCYTDLGLDPTAFASPINGIIYSVGGSGVGARPAPGYVMTVTDMSGRVRWMTNNLMWAFVYNAANGNWYFHTTNPSDQVDIATLKIATTP